MRGVAATSFLVVLAFLSAGAFQARPPKGPRDTQSMPVKGPDLFRTYCAACHGPAAGGDGPAAPALKIAVPDLTRIAQRNGGPFPGERVRQLIAGDDAIQAHGSRQMPIWGPIFHQVERDQDWGEVRLRNITEYLQSIQRK